ncbi:MAG: Smr/MutS family protein [Rhodobacteraceae bacterium]|nr:Smr/MutS family protein [Paracoccaceae bacterium]
MSGRKLRPEEKELWNKVAAKTHKMDDGPKPDMSAFLATEVNPRPLSEVARSVLGEAAKPVKPLSAGAAPAYMPTVAMDKKTFQGLRRGKLKPEARLDLHGLTLEHAYPTLTRFIMTSWNQGHRLVLVITGKGRDRPEHGPIPLRQGVLRHQVPQWLNMPPLKRIVLQVADAHQRHGGGGAYYVYLRRQR